MVLVVLVVAGGLEIIIDVASSKRLVERGSPGKDETEFLSLGNSALPFFCFVFI